MQAKILALFLILNINCWSASSLTNIVSIFGSVVEIPSERLALRPRVILSCVISTTPGVDYTTQWMGPGDVGIINPTTNAADKYNVTEGNVPIQNGSMLPGTTLAIRRLSYRDAGLYTCSGRSTATSFNEEVPSTSSMVSATIDLQLNVDLSSKYNETMVMATTSDDRVELSCEMSAFIRPDTSLIWEGPDNQILANGTKYQITFSNGSRYTAIDGSGGLVPSRISTLTISNPDKSDRGVYTCSIMGTNATIDLVIMINDANTSTAPATTVSVDDSTGTEASTESDTTTAAMDGVTTVEMDGVTTAGMDGVTTAGMDGVTTAEMDGVTTAGMDGGMDGGSGSNGSKSSQNYVNTAVISIIMLAGVLTQLLNG